jgi:hypothetical protein
VDIAALAPSVTSAELWRATSAMSNGASHTSPSWLLALRAFVQIASALAARKSREAGLPSTP